MGTSAKSRPLDMKNSWRKGKTSGWTAFDRERRRNDAGEPEAKAECFPSLSSTVVQIPNLLGNTDSRIVLEKPFASLLQGSKTHYNMDIKTPQVGSSSMSGNVIKRNGVIDVTLAYDMLKQHHPWAEQSLIEDVLAGVNNDIVKASTLLANMVSSENNNEENLGTVIKELTYCNSEESVLQKVSVDRAVDVSEPNCVIEGLTVDSKKYQGEQASYEKVHVHDDLNSETSRISYKYIPMEPEWEEDDVYFAHRKDALRMMRSASQHSKAASDAYIRGDHISAQLYSQKAREEWLTAEKLNAKAAKEILAIRNSNNDEWTLDLHGLHASEAINALQVHLQKIESRLPVKLLTSVNATSESVYFSFPESASCSDSAKLGNRITFVRPKPTSLNVITGKGNHSRGEAAIPAAIRSFLIENGYRYDETRPGVIEVKPKFRR